MKVLTTFRQSPQSGQAGCKSERRHPNQRQNLPHHKIACPAPRLGAPARFIYAFKFQSVALGRSDWPPVCRDRNLPERRLSSLEDAYAQEGIASQGKTNTENRQESQVGSDRRDGATTETFYEEDAQRSGQQKIPRTWDLRLCRLFGGIVHDFPAPSDNVRSRGSADQTGHAGIN